jgi:hypothetical protein
MAYTNPEEARAYARAWRKANREKCLAYHRKWATANPDKVKASVQQWLDKHPRYQTEWARSKRTGCSPEQFRTAFDKQGGCCALCHLPMLEEPRADHNHETGKFRALLHNHCNLAIGMFNDDIRRLFEAIEYLNLFQ